MKRIMVVLIVAFLLVSPVFSQLRIDAGVSIPVYVGVIGEDVDSDDGVSGVLLESVFPLPEGDFYYQLDGGMIKLCLGVRVFTLVLESVAWPDVMLEVDLGNVLIQAHAGGGVFALFGLANDVQSGPVLIPEVSAWVALGKSKRLRIGAGVMGMMLPELEVDAMLILPYVGAKLSFDDILD